MVIGSLEPGHRLVGTRRSPSLWIALLIAVVVVAVTDPFAGTAQVNEGVSDNSYPTSIARVTEQSLSSQTVLDATLGYAGSFTVVNQARGVLTALPALGQVVTEGQALYEVNGSPVFLLYGATPCYRNLLEGVHGTDVSQLNTDLVKLGYGTRAQLLGNPDYFSSQTARALERLQVHLRLPPSGELVKGEAVFVPSTARITSVSATLGAPVQSGVPIITATSTTREVRSSPRRLPAVRGEGRRPGHRHAAGQLDDAGRRLLGRHRRDGAGRERGRVGDRVRPRRSPSR